MEKTRLLEVRKQLRKRKPDFIRSDYGKKARLDKKWRKPRGKTNKLRLKKRGYRVYVSSGYRSPALIRGFSKNGLEPIIVNNLSDLNSMDKNTQTAVISSTMGQRKKIEIVKKAKEMKIVLQNVNDIEKYLKSVEKNMELRKSNKKEIINKKKERVKEAEAKLKEAEKKKNQKEVQEPVKEVSKDKISESEKVEKSEETKKKEKTEKDKILTQRQ